MRRVKYFLLLVPMLLVAATASWAAGQATPDEAKAMAIKAAEYLKAVGPDKAFPEFDAKGGPWHDRDLYVTVISDQGVMLAHGTNAGLIGRNVLQLKDPEGNAFNLNIVAIKDAAWVNFKWQNPMTHSTEPKTAYYVRVGNDLVGVGAYAK